MNKDNCKSGPEKWLVTIPENRKMLVQIIKNTYFGIKNNLSDSTIENLHKYNLQNNENELKFNNVTMKSGVWLTAIEKNCKGHTSSLFGILTDEGTDSSMH